MKNNFQLKAEYVWLTDALQTDLDAIAQWHIEKLKGNYLKKYDWTDAEVFFHLRVEKTKKDKYECKFNVNINWEQFYWDTDVPFKEPFDVVNHAFKHLKEHLAKGK